VSTYFIHHLRITNFKSIDSLVLENVQPFSVFAGANGCGKSNFFDALNFVSLFVRNGIHDALRKYGGYEHVHSQKRRKSKARSFDFEIDVSLEDHGHTSRFKYLLSIDGFDINPSISEDLYFNHELLMRRIDGGFPVFLQNYKDGKVESILVDGAWGGLEVKNFPVDYSALLLFSETPIGLFLKNIRLYRIDPISSKEPNSSDQDPSNLNSKGDNLASVLGRLEGDENFRGIILEWMETLVPGIEKINTERQKLDSKTAILFKELGTRRLFPANMVSDGTIYALCLLVAVLDRPEYGLTLIEEPERGLHPKAINELTGLIREYSRIGSAIWLSTHSEAVVRGLKLQELWLVDKLEGKTRMRNAVVQGLTDEDLAPLGLDKAWLSNLLDGGLPW